MLIYQTWPIGLAEICYSNLTNWLLSNFSLIDFHFWGGGGVSQLARFDLVNPTDL